MPRLPSPSALLLLWGAKIAPIHAISFHAMQNQPDDPWLVITVAGFFIIMAILFTILYVRDSKG